MKQSLENLERAFQKLRNRVSNYIRVINFKKIEDNTLIVSFHTSTNTIETIEVESIERGGKIVGNCGTETRLYDLTIESVGYVFEYYYDLIESLDSTKLENFGICITNDSCGNITICKIDNVEYLTNVKFTIKSDEDAIIIANNLDKISCNRVLSVKEYVEKLGIKNESINDILSIEDVQKYTEEFMDLALFDYPICEIEDVFNEVNQNLVLVYDNSIDDIRVCEI